MNVRVGRIPPRETSKKARGYSAYSFPPPSLGLMAMNNAAVSVPGAAEVLENFFPTSTGARMRRGKQIYATLGAGEADVTSIFSYVVGNQRELFASTATTIYNITSVASPINLLIGTEDEDIIGTEDDDFIGVSSTEDLEVYENTTGGNWVVAQFATAGGAFLIGVNGTDAGFIYDGNAFYPLVAGGVTAIPFSSEVDAFTAGETVTGGTSGATATIWKVESDGSDGTLYVTGIAGGPFQNGETLTDGDVGEATADSAGTVVSGTNYTFAGGGSFTTADLSYVWIYKNRLWFIQKDSLTAWYLPVDQVSGELTAFPLGGVLGKGGSLKFGATWSQDVGDGLNALCAFVSSEGEAAVYQGSNPADAATWGIVGVYQTGKPLGIKAHIQIGGDIAMASDIAFVPLSEALRREYSQLGANSLSAPIEALWPVEVSNRGGADWNCAFWSARQMVVVGMPTINQNPPAMLVMNSRTGKWGYFTNWSSTCLHVFNDRLFAGDTDGRVFELDVTGLDDSVPYTATYVPSFDQMDKPGYKTVHMVRAVMKGPVQVREQIRAHSDFTINLPAAPSASPVSAPAAWGTAVWGQFTWGDEAAKKVHQRWRNQVGTGEAIAPSIQITSGSTIPLDVELVRTDVLFSVAAPLA